MKKLLGFFISKFLWVNVLLLIIAFIVIVKLALVFTDIYSHHGESIVVPDLTGMQVEEAKTKLKTMKLKLLVVDSLYKNKVKPGSIISQVPKPGFAVKRKRKIKLVVATSTPEKVELQKGIDLSLRQAIQMLMSKGLEVGELRFKQSQFSNLVLGFEIDGKTIEESTIVNKGTVVDIIVGKDYRHRAVVPRLKDKYLEDASIQILMSGLNLGRIEYSESVETYLDTLKATVYKQSMMSGNKVTPGSKINIYLTKK